MRTLVFSCWLLASISAWADEASCLKTGKDCSEIDIDSPKAREAYEAGCKARDFYSCTRLGQFLQYKKLNSEKALEEYEKACEGKDKQGCDAAYELTMDFCFNQSKSKFCEKREPKGEFRILAFLKEFHPKFKDAFAGHNFEGEWSQKKAEELFKARMKEKNKKLLKALLLEKRSGKHDGADAEMLDYYINCTKGKCPRDTETEGD